MILQFRVLQPGISYSSLFEKLREESEPNYRHADHEPEDEELMEIEDGYTDDAKTICSFFIPGYERGIAVYEEVEINGMFGLSTQNHIVWADPTVHKVFHLTSEDITGDELLKIAQSIQER